MFETLTSLYLAWQSPSPTRGWYPVGKLDYVKQGKLQPFYRFTYTHGAKRAEQEAQFHPIDSFPDFARIYESTQLFPLFQNRLMDNGRIGFTAYLNSLDLPTGYREPIHILAVSGGNRQTDSFEVFPKIEPASNGDFEHSFFLHGIRYLESSAITVINNLRIGEKVRLVHESKNPGSQRPALRVETLRGEAIGYTPNYLVSDFQYIRANCIYPESVTIKRINQANPLDSRVLLRFTGCWPNSYIAMIPDDFKELAQFEFA